MSRRAIIGGLLVTGSLMLPLGVPAAWLWVSTRLTDDSEWVLPLALLGCPMAMALWGLVLGALNRRFHEMGSAIPLMEAALVIAMLISCTLFVAWLLFWRAPGAFQPFPVL